MVQGLGILKASLTSTFALTDGLKHLIRETPTQEKNILVDVKNMILKMFQQVQFWPQCFWTLYGCITEIVVLFTSFVQNSLPCQTSRQNCYCSRS